MHDPLKVLVLPRYDRKAASTRHRFLQFAAPLASQGIELTSMPLLPDAYLESRYAGSESTDTDLNGRFAFEWDIAWRHLRGSCLASVHVQHLH